MQPRTRARGQPRVQRRANFRLGAGCFFALLITLIIWLYEVYKPVYDVRFGGSPARVRPR